jgi:hypothetical protein
LVNSISQALDAAGRVHVIAIHLPDEVPEPPTWPQTRAASRYQHYWRDTDGRWNRRQLPFGSGDGTRPQLAMDSDGNAYIVFALDDRLCVAASTARAQWADWQLIYRGDDFAVTGEPRFDPVRWSADGVLSVYVQELPSAKDAAASPLRAIEFDLD